jgi:hypothetical protein
MHLLPIRGIPAPSSENSFKFSLKSKFYWFSNPIEPTSMIFLPGIIVLRKTSSSFSTKGTINA